MDERRESPAEPGTQPPIAAPTELSPVQQAQQRRRVHASSCPQCADIDRQLCTEGDRLWKAWNTALDDAYRQLNGDTR